MSSNLHSHATQKPSHDPALKGVRNGNCNRTACQAPHAVYYNPYTYAYYCKNCVGMLHEVWRNESAMTKRCHVPMTLIDELWKKLGEIPANDDGELLESFHTFPAGTHREEAWHQFDEWLEYHDTNLGNYMHSSRQ